MISGFMFIRFALIFKISRTTSTTIAAAMEAGATPPKIHPPKNLQHQTKRRNQKAVSDLLLHLHPPPTPLEAWF